VVVWVLGGVGFGFCFLFCWFFFFFFFFSGEETVGGDFHFRTNVLAGDVNGDGVVNFTGDLLPTSEQNTLIPTTLGQSYFDITADGVVNLTGDVMGISDRNTDLLPASPAVPNPPVVFDSAEQSLANQATDEFSQEDAYATFVKNYIDVFASVPSLTEEVSAVQDQNSESLATPSSPTYSAVAPESASTSPADQLAATVVQEDLPTVIEQSDVYVSSGIDLVSAESVTGEIGQNTILTATLPAIANPSIAPQPDSSLQIDSFMIDFAQEDERDEEGEVVLEQNLRLAQLPTGLSNQSSGAELASVSLVDHFMAYFAEGDEEDKEDELFGDYELETLVLDS